MMDGELWGAHSDVEISHDTFTWMEAWTEVKGGPMEISVRSNFG